MNKIALGGINITIFVVNSEIAVIIYLKFRIVPKHND